MPRIPTYSAERDIAAGPVGVEASVASFTAPARALGSVAGAIDSAGQQTERALYQISAADEQRKDRDDAFWAADQADNLTREFLEFQNKNAESETAADDFLKFSEERVNGIASGAPSATAGQRFRRLIGDNVTSVYGRSLAVSTAVREQNHLVSLTGAAQNLGGMINQGGGGYSIEIVKPLIEARVEAINKMNLSDASKRKLRSAFYEELALSTGPNEPEFALSLIDSPDFDESRKRVLRGQIESYQNANDAAAIATFRMAEKQRISSALENGIPVAPPTDGDLQTLFGDNWKAQRVVIDEEYRVANTAIGKWNKVGSWSYPNAAVELKSNMKSGDDDVNSILGKKLDRMFKDQNGPSVSSWVQKNIKAVSDSYTVAYAAPDGPERTAKLTAAHALNLQYQGDPPMVVTGDEAKKYLRKPPAEQHLLTTDMANEWAAEVNSMQGPQLLDFLNVMAVQYPDDQQRALAWNDLVTIPQKGIKPEIQFAMMIPTRQVREQYLNVAQNKVAIEKLNPDTKKKFTEALNSKANEDWSDFKQAIDPGIGGQRSKMLTQFEGAVLVFAEHLGSKGLDPDDATWQAVNTLISGSWGFTKVNGQVLAIQKLRDDFGQKPTRTNDEIKQVGRLLESAISSVRSDNISTENPDGSSVFPLADLNAEKGARQRNIANTIRSAGFFVMDPDGQGAQLYLRDSKSKSVFPLRDSNGRIYGVNFDDLNIQTMMGAGQIPAAPWRNLRR